MDESGGGSKVVVMIIMIMVRRRRTIILIQKGAVKMKTVVGMRKKRWNRNKQDPGEEQEREEICKLEVLKLLCYLTTFMYTIYRPTM